MTALSRHARSGNKKAGTQQQKLAQKRDKRAKKAAAAEAALAAAAEEAAEAANDQENDDEQVVRRSRPNTAEEERIERDMIVRWFKKKGEPPESMWDGVAGIVAQIADHLDKKKTADRRPIRRTLERYVAGEPLATHGGGQKPKLTHNESLVAASVHRLGFGEEQRSRRRT